MRSSAAASLFALMLSPMCHAVAPAVALWQAYSSALVKHPLRTQMVSSAVIWGVGDVTAQRLSSLQPQGADKKASEPVQYQRAAKQMIYASLVWTPIAANWYKALERVVCKVAVKGTAKFVACKVASEVVAFHPVSLAAYFVCLGLAQGDGFAAITAKARRDFLPTLKMEVALWTPLDVCLFAVVPVPFQLLAVDSGCFLESVALSWVNANGLTLPSCFVRKSSHQ